MDLELIRAMTGALAHRGPDGSGIYQKPGVALGHRRLSVIDVEGGAQPLSNEDENVWVTFNGEIYNYQSLRTELERAGHQFRTRSDTEVLVHLYEEVGSELTDRLRGMFAFAIWDARNRTLLIARDRLGQKPLVYWHDHRGFRFASEMKSLAADKDFPRDVDPIALDEYLTYQYVPHPRTIYRAARKLPPAHRAQWRDGELTVERYWQPQFLPVANRTWEEDVASVREALAESTRLRMVSDVPIGAFLSGGVDSTVVAGIMQSLSSRPVETFSIGFPVREYDETRYARLAAKHLGTNHHELILEPNAVRSVWEIAEFYDEPFADSSAIPTYFLSRFARRNVTVALTGDGGDELFLGYDRYRAVRWASHFDRLPKSVRGLASATFWQRIPTPGMQKSNLRRAKRMLEVLGSDPCSRYQQLVTIFSPERRAALYSLAIREALRDHDSSRWVKDLYRGLEGRDFLTQTGLVDLQSYLPGDILTKVDIASMAHGLECRSPMLDHPFVELVSQLPQSRKVRNGGTKAILIAAFRSMLPPAIRKRPKMGFGVPLDRWFRSDLRGLLRETVLSTSANGRGWFEPAAVEQLVQEHESGSWDHSARLWALLMLELWASRYLDGLGSPARTTPT